MKQGLLLMMLLLPGLVQAAPLSQPSTVAAASGMSMQECMDNCSRCHQLCLETIQHCLKLGGAHASPEHLARLQDCAATCQASVDFMARHSDLHGSVCGVCAEACGRCAESCEKMAGGDNLMKRCAEACRRSEASCKAMSGHGHHG